jgi:hypothetical protein
VTVGTVEVPAKKLSTLTISSLLAPGDIDAVVYVETLEASTALVRLAAVIAMDQTPVATSGARLPE